MPYERVVSSGSIRARRPPDKSKGRQGQPENRADGSHGTDGVEGNHGGRLRSRRPGVNLCLGHRPAQSYPMPCPSCWYVRPDRAVAVGPDSDLAHSAVGWRPPERSGSESRPTEWRSHCRIEPLLLIRGSPSGLRTESARGPFAPPRLGSATPPSPPGRAAGGFPAGCRFRARAASG